MLKIWIKQAVLCRSITLENKYYEYEKYNIGARYQPGLLELDAKLDEPSLKPRAETNEVAGSGGILSAFGSLAGNAVYMPSLLSRVMNRPSERVILLLMPGESASLSGIRTTSSASTNDEEKKSQLMLNAKEVRLTRRE